MAGWATCSGCGLKHTRRPSGTCPRCGQAVEPPDDATAPLLRAVSSQPPPPPPRALPSRQPSPLPRAVPSEQTPPLPQAFSSPEPPPLQLGASIESEDDRLGNAARLAGALMIVNGVLLLAEQGAMGTSANAGSVIGSFLIGGLVAFGSTRAALFAQVVAFLGLTFLSLSLLGKGQSLLAGLQLSYSAGLLLLLFRRAPTWRAVAGVILVALPFGMQCFGLYGIATGHFPLARLLAAKDLTDLKSGSVHGAKFQYLVDNPGKTWSARSQAALAREHTAADLWLTRPDRDAHILIVPEALSANMTLDMDRFQAAVLKNYAAYAFVIREQSPIPGTVGDARLLRGKGHMPTGDLEFMIALYVQPPYAAQVVGFGPTVSFGEVSEDVRRVVTSLRF